MGDTPDDRELEKRMLLFVAAIIGLGIAILGFIGLDWQLRPRRIAR